MSPIHTHEYPSPAAGCLTKKAAAGCRSPKRYAPRIPAVNSNVEASTKHKCVDGMAKLLALLPERHF
jgi:hypothetical protein